MCYSFRAILDAADADPLRCPSQPEGVGSPRKHMPRKKIPADLRSLARGHTEQCIKVLAGIVSQEAVPAAARVSAAGILLDRGWGKAIQPHTGEEGGDIRVTIRHILEHIDEKPVIIDGEEVRCIDEDTTERCIDEDITDDAQVVRDDEGNSG